MVAKSPFFAFTALGLFQNSRSKATESADIGVIENPELGICVKPRRTIIEKVKLGRLDARII